MAAEPLGPYGLLARFVLHHRGGVALAVALLVLLGALLGLPPKISSSLLSLMPEDDPASMALRQLEAEEGGVNTVSLSFSSDDPEQLESFLVSLEDELVALERVEYSFRKLDPDVAFEIGLLQLDPADVSEFTVRLKGALALGSALNPIVTQRLMAMGELSERIGQASAPSMLEPRPGTGRILLRPTGPSNNQAFAVALMADVEALVSTHLAAAPEVKLLWIGGAYRHVVEDLHGIQQDIVATSVISTTLVLLVIIVTFRTWRATLLVFVPLVVANLVNLGVAAVGAGGLNTYTSFGTAILVGLGIDFAVHLIGRYREYRSEGVELEQAVCMAWDHTGPPCTTAALTSAAGFLALAGAQFRGFSQLGLLLASGLILCLLAMLVVLPLLIPTLDANPPPLLGAGRVQRAHVASSYALAPVGLMLAVLVTGVVGAARLPELSWEFDISTLRRDGLAYNELSDVERALARDAYSPEVVLFKKRRQLVRAQRKLQRRLEAGELPHVAAVASVESVLPSDQAARLQALNELKVLLGHRNLRYLPPPLVKPLLPLRDHDLKRLRRRDLPPGLLAMLAANKPGRFRLLVLPKGNMWDMREAAALADELHDALPRYPIAGEHLALGALYRTVMRDMPLVALLALVMVTLITAIDLKRLHWIAGAVGTLMAGMIWAGSMVQMAGVRLSILNVVGLPILLGIGVDVVIHLLHRLAEEGPGGVRRALRTTGVAATISTLTTVLSFVSLLAAGNRGVRSLGVLVVIGLSSVFLASAVLLPLSWAAGWKVTGRAPADAPEPPPPVL